MVFSFLQIGFNLDYTDFYDARNNNLGKKLHLLVIFFPHNAVFFILKNIRFEVLTVEFLFDINMQ